MTLCDTIGDTFARRTDFGADGPFDPDLHPPIDLREVTIGTWAATVPASDLFSGGFIEGGKFVRLDLALTGLVNPPGEVTPFVFDPFRFGDRPVFGFVEIDIDNSVLTGGELESPHFHYLGNIARFGGKPSEPEFADRVALDASAFDDLFLTAPFIERHGEEFHLALLDAPIAIDDVQVVSGDDDASFESGETWIVRGPFFHRAHGYEPFSLASGGGTAGEYAPTSTVRFQHDPLADVTTVSLVFPLTNVGAGLMLGEPPQPPNHNPSDQASVLEALLDLYQSAAIVAAFPTGQPEEALILDWVGTSPEILLHPAQWKLTVLLGTSYNEPIGDAPHFVWTDVYPNVRRGDVNGDDSADATDRQLIQEHIDAHDDQDGVIDGRAVMAGFAADFSVFDINHDGAVDAVDILLVSVPGDTDDDGDVDLADWAWLERCFLGANVAYAEPACALADVDTDADVDLEDARRLGVALTGPSD